jgi:ATP-binding cassette subfamily B protein
VTHELDACVWPARLAAEALEAVAHHSGLPVQRRDSASPLDVSGGPEHVAQSLDFAAAALGLEVEAVEARFADVERCVRGIGPALLRVGEGEAGGLLAVSVGGRRMVTVVTPGRTARRIPVPLVRAFLCDALERRVSAETDTLLEEAGVVGRRRQRVRNGILRERLAAAPAANGWIVRLPPGAAVEAQASVAGLWRRLAALIAAHATSYLLWIASWWIIGRAALEGRLDRGWLLAWTLLLATLIPFELLVTWLQGRLAIEAGALLKRRLLHGALQLAPEEIRHEGAGHLLGRVIESQAIEALSLSGGALALVSIIELLFAVAVLATVRWWLPLLLLACTAVHLLCGWRFFVARRRWAADRLAMTHDLVERMVGHRTRAAQEQRSAWHAGEDETLERYLSQSSGMDRAAVRVVALAPRSWLLIGSVGLGVLFVTAEPTYLLAVTLGGTIMAYRALRKLAAGSSDLAGAAIAWTQASPIFRAAARPQPIGTHSLVEGTPIEADAASCHPLMDARDLVFRYRDRGDPVLSGCTLSVFRGDRLLLQGESGSGKSTLASTLVGLRVPESGLLLLDGADRQSVGAAQWRRRVVAVPQFHENHVFAGSFGFNLLMGHRWPPSPGDLQRAEALCAELGLGDLLRRMPAGLLQEVGETGWQLSHGERSRLFIARALLQDADLLVLDESFAQLDPENLERALGHVMKRASTLLLIAHP